MSSFIDPLEQPKAGTAEYFFACAKDKCSALTDEPPPKVKGLLPRPAVKGGTGHNGESDWHGMWTPAAGPKAPDGPVDAALRKELITYGDLCQFTYANFKISTTADGEKIGTIKYSPSELLKAPSAQVMVADNSPARQYAIEDDNAFYLYATSGLYKGTLGDIQDLSTNWIGFVAVSEPDAASKKRDLAVVWRGTVAKTEWLSDVTCEFARWDEVNGKGQDVDIEKGFEQLYRNFTSTPGNSLSLQGQVQVAVHKLLAKHPDIGTITTTGHSLGGALASLSAYDIAFSEINRVGDHSNGQLMPVTAFTFEAPRVGNEAYAEGFKTGGDSQLKMLRVVNVPDIVPKLPYDAWTWRDAVSPLRLFRFLMTPVKIVLGGASPPEAKYRDAFHHGGIQYTVDTTTLVERDEHGHGTKPPGKDTLMYVDNEPLSLAALKQHHNLPLVLWLIDNSRPFPPDPAKVLLGLEHAA